MQNYYIEKRPMTDSMLLSWDLAHHIYTRGVQGRIAIATDKPVALLATTRKQWLKLIRQVHRERASTLRATRIMELSAQIAWMQRLTFSCKPPEGAREDDITFATAASLAEMPPICTALYITCSVTDKCLSQITRRMEKGSVIIIYGQ